MDVRRAALGALAGATFVGLATLAVVPAEAGPDGADSGESGLEVYTGLVDPEDVETLREQGLDAESFVVDDEAAGGKVEVEVVVTDEVATKLQDEGVEIDVKEVDGVAASKALAREARAGWDAFREYGAPGGIKDEVLAAGGRNKDIAEVVEVGETLNGEDILALRVTKDARRTRDGRRPAVLYMGAQHAREWITPEMVRRLMHHVLDGYGSDAEITRLVDTTELWFLPVANPDGYDFTFTEGNRLWRKNLRDNNGDGQVTTGDGVDLNRNFAVNWGYDNEGSSVDTASETFRGAGPNSEPETQVLDRLSRRIGFEFVVNYHSAANLLLYGIGHQVTTPSPDDVIYEAMVGTDENPAVPTYDPDLSAELYTTNGDTDTHMQVRYGTLGFTPEMSTCEVASDRNPDDEWEAEDCVSGFVFPDDEDLIAEEFEMNVPFALAVAESAHDPDDPVSVTGLDAADLVADPFEVSYGTRQQVAVTAKRSLRGVRAYYQVNNGRPQSKDVREWRGGERYGDTHDDYYGEFRATIKARPGDTVEVWFSGRNGNGRKAQWVETEPFTYEVADDVGGDVLVLAVEDVTGLSPAQGLTEAQYVDEHVAAVEEAGYDADVYDFDAMGRQAPHHLGVLSHYDAVVWETGNDLLLRSVGQTPGTVAKAALDIELAVRDYLNEGGKAVVAGKNALTGQRDGYYYNPFAPPECTTQATYPCLALSNDFMQYWLGAYVNISDGGTDETGEPFELVGEPDTAFDGFTGDLNAAGSAGNQDHTALLLSTSSFLPPEEFPLFDGTAPLDWQIPGGPFDPRTGDWYVFSQQTNQSWKRLSRTVDLTGATSGELDFWTSYDTEADWDFLMVEARIVDGDADPSNDVWTTLPDANGHTQQLTAGGTFGQSCTAGWAHGADAIHPFLAHYQGEDCVSPGTTGEWNAASGTSPGWVNWSVDLSSFAGQQVELSISYVSDWATQNVGVFLDDVTVTVDGASTDADPSFESGLGEWSVSGAPEGSATNTADWVRTQLGFDEGAATLTDDTAFLGFGLEGLAPAERDDLVARTLEALLD